MVLILQGAKRVRDPLQGVLNGVGKVIHGEGRDRPVEENLDLFQRMRAGEFPEGKYTLRAKIDLASGNFNMRDPVLYRIRYIEHHRQGTKWCIWGSSQPET